MSQEDFARLPEFREQENYYMDAEDEWDEKLKPCPFCGAPAELQTVPDGHPDSGAMFCQCSGNGCLASSALIVPLMDDVTGLVRERWNRREDDKYRKALAGLPDGAIDGGWTAAGMSAYAKRVEDALDSIIRYGTDTLSGRVDGPDDREWQRGAVLEMTTRAKAAMRHNICIPRMRSISAHAFYGFSKYLSLLLFFLSGSTSLRQSEHARYPGYRVSLYPDMRSLQVFDFIAFLNFIIWILRIALLQSAHRRAHLRRYTVQTDHILAPTPGSDTTLRGV